MWKKHFKEPSCNGKTLTTLKSSWVNQLEARTTFFLKSMGREDRNFRPCRTYCGSRKEEHWRIQLPKQSNFLSYLGRSEESGSIKNLYVAKEKYIFWNSAEKLVITKIGQKSVWPLIQKYSYPFSTKKFCRPLFFRNEDNNNCNIDDVYAPGGKWVVKSDYNIQSELLYALILTFFLSTGFELSGRIQSAEYDFEQTLTSSVFSLSDRPIFFGDSRVSAVITEKAVLHRLVIEVDLKLC